LLSSRLSTIGYISFKILAFISLKGLQLYGKRKRKRKNYNSKREDIEEEDQREDEGNVIL